MLILKQSFFRPEIATISELFVNSFIYLFTYIHSYIHLINYLNTSEYILRKVYHVLSAFLLVGTCFSFSDINVNFTIRGGPS